MVYTILTGSIEGHHSFTSLPSCPMCYHLPSTLPVYRRFRNTFCIAPIDHNTSKNFKTPEAYPDTSTPLKLIINSSIYSSTNHASFTRTRSHLDMTMELHSKNLQILYLKELVRQRPLLSKKTKAKRRNK